MPDEEPRVRLWSDDPSRVDLLSFDAVADTVADAVLDDGLDPLALGISGPWGSGKTTVLRLVENRLADESKIGSRIIVVDSDPWRYDPAVGAKESLISQVLDALTAEFKSELGGAEKALETIKRLAKRVDWSKAISVAARASLMLQIPSVDDLTSLIKEDGLNGESQSRGLDSFRDEFARLMESPELTQVRRVVVLVDDLDRCLPETVVETLEAIRLFLAVPKMSFVLAADDERVAEAIRAHYPMSDRPDESSSAPREEPSKLYLHKIVQTTVPLPALSRFDTEAFLLLLQLQNRESDPLTEQQFTTVLEGCSKIRTTTGDLDELKVPKGVSINDELAFAARLTPMLYEKLRGNPRRVKRFLNDLNVRRSIARRRGIALQPAVVAKLMVLEVLLSDEFKIMLGWLAKGELRQQVASLERQSREPSLAPAAGSPAESAAAGDAQKPRRTLSVARGGELAGLAGEEFSENFIRWSKLPPDLRDLDLAPYLYLAASFAGEPLLDTDLPERLRDIAANLVSSSRAEQKSVQASDLAALTSSDTDALLQHLGRVARDRPREQRSAVTGILRVHRVHPSHADAAVRALLALPIGEVAMPTVLLFGDPADAALKPVLDEWKSKTTNGLVKNAVDEAVKRMGAG
ncbi:MAG: NTPase [Actinobacteria bacterium HGW-Actinobacteria-1]|jgi:hypothetical protein|nr:MAG: NTPase [Actinobacteria bacterium HGW-Actinobacteria-1]